MNRRWLNFAKELLSLPTSPLHEEHIAAWVKAFGAERGMTVRADRHGNLTVRYRKGSAARRPLVICAHMDHPGFAAVKMLDDRTLLAEWSGGVPAELFPGAKVRFFADGKWIRGTVIDADAEAAPLQTRPVRIRALRSVPAGAIGMWDFGEPSLRGCKLYAPSHDDIIGVAAIAATLDELRRRKVSADFRAFFTRGEEGGFYGAIAACRTGTLPGSSLIVALEASRELANARLGDGVILRVGDRTSIFTPAVTAMIRETADALAKRDKTFKYQRRLMDGGTCESSVYTAYGYDAGGLCLPLRNYHNVDWDAMKLAPECIDLRDYEALVTLLVEMAKRHAKAKPMRSERARWDKIFQERFEHL